MLTTPDGSKYLTVKEAARETGLPVGVIYDAIRKKDLEARTRRGTKSPKYVSEAALNTWWENGFVVV